MRAGERDQAAGTAERTERTERRRAPADARGSASGEGDRPGLLDRLRALFGLGGASIRDEFEDALDDTDAGGAFSSQERSLLRNVLGLHEVRVDDIMVPRADVIAVGAAMTLYDVLAVFRESGHSRLPVHGDTLDDPRGMVHVRDFVELLAKPLRGATASATAETSVAVDLSLPVAQSEVIRPVLFVPPSMPALDLLVRMQASRTHMALVIDEYGGTDGLATIEDIVEKIVGDIEDEHDEGEQVMIERTADGSYLADARAGLEDVSEALGVDLSGIDDADEIDTLGGLVTSVAGRVPNRGEVVRVHEAFDAEILDADPRRVKRVRILPLGERAPEGGGPPAGGGDPGGREGSPARPGADPA